MVRSRRQALQSVAAVVGGLAVAGCIEESTRNPGNDDSDDVTSDEPTATDQPSPEHPNDRGTPRNDTAADVSTDRSPTDVPTDQSQSDSPTDGPETPVAEGYLADVSNYDGSVTDRTDQPDVTVEVGAESDSGNFAFEPPALRVTTGTSVTWEWTGEGGAHNVVAEDDSFESDLLSETGSTFQHTFENAGTYRYYCAPHKALGMKGVVEVVA